jgi:hypothetical protein
LCGGDEALYARNLKSLADFQADGLDGNRQQTHTDAPQHDHFGANGACGKLYPVRMRTSGLGWALCLGRLGDIAAGPFGGALLALGFKPPHIFLSARLFAAIAAVVTGLLFFRGNHKGPAEEPVAAT